MIEKSKQVGCIRCIFVLKNCASIDIRAGTVRSPFEQFIVSRFNTTLYLTLLSNVRISLSHKLIQKNYVKGAYPSLPLRD